MVISSLAAFAPVKSNPHKNFPADGRAPSVAGGIFLPFVQSFNRERRGHTAVSITSFSLTKLSIHQMNIFSTRHFAIIQLLAVYFISRYFQAPAS